jgi:TonB dependent receptor/TonB-dependent Receptor Plug Domain
MRASVEELKVLGALFEQTEQTPHREAGHAVVMAWLKLPYGFVLVGLLCGAAASRATAQSVPLNVAPASKPMDGADPAGWELAPSNLPAEVQVKSQAIPAIYSNITVNAVDEALRTGQPMPYHVTQSEVLAAAGTWGDFSRFLQLLPGVVWNTDVSNDVLVRGGNPSENLYVVDGIEVPNINHLAMEGTTGGFASMVDTSNIQSVDLKAGSYDAQYASRLSSLIEIQTRKSAPGATQEIDGGISGAGGFLQQQLGKAGNLLLSAHRSVLNLVTNNIGLNGVPIYTNGLARIELAPDSRNSISALSLSGADSINIRPVPCDAGVTLNVQTQYGGARSTDGVVWRHVHSSNAASTVVVSYSYQEQDIGQQLQATAFYGMPGCDSDPVEATPVYVEHTKDGIGTLGYNGEMGWRNLLLSMGTRGQLLTMNYAVAQPLGQQSTFNPDPAWTDADNFTRHLTTVETGSFAQVTSRVGTRWTLISGVREETFSLTGAQAFEPRASLAFRISDYQNVNASWSRSAQLAPNIDILSYSQNRRLHPITAEQVSVGAELWRARWASLHVESYEKRYSHEPVSTEYPSLMLANMVDTLGQQFVWLPLRTGGHGRAAGVELLAKAHPHNWVELMTSLSYSRTRYAAADGVLRPGNFDFPLVGSGLTNLRLWKRIQISVRDTYATGRPYTPFDVTLSEEQSRGIYDLTRVNGLRGPAYNRVDADINRDFHLGKGVLNLHGGVENALDRSNFLGYAWMDNCHPGPSQTECGMNQNAIPGVPETRITQMPLFPSATVRYTF